MGGELSAHQKKEAITRIIFNQRTSSIEIIHRFSIHDAEHVTKQLFGKQADIISNPNSQQQFADYVTNNFTMKNLSGEPFPLKNIGFEIDSNHLWIYQEAPLQQPIKGLLITQAALINIWPQQTNLVNIERNKKVRSLIFKGTSTEQKITFAD